LDSNLIKTIKELEKSGVVELISTAAYHPLLTKISDWAIEKQIVLNEFGLGYYLGSKKGFEGEDAVLLQNIVGFFPPELAVNENVVSAVKSLGYSWMLVDSVCIDEANDITVGEFNDMILVIRDTRLSNLISFKRDTDIHDILSELEKTKKVKKNVVVALDAEFFGHHFKKGILLLEKLVVELDDLGINMTTVSSLISNVTPTPIQNVRESTWGASYQDIIDGNIYPFWDVSGNKLHQKLWELQKLLEAPDALEVNIDPALIPETFPVWDTNEINNLPDENSKKGLLKELLTLKCMSSDQFWWSSKAKILDLTLYDPEMVKKSLQLYKRYAEFSGNSTKINELIFEIESLL